MQNKVGLTIVIPTVGRVDEVRRLVASLLEQKRETLSRVEVVVVDQNDDDSAEKELASLREVLSLKHIRAKRRGLSFAKNQGLKVAVGDFCVFLDDDCWLGPDFIQNLLSNLDGLVPGNGLIIRALDPSGGFLVPSDLRPGFVLDRGNVRMAFVAPQIAQVYPLYPAKALNGFNEKLGIGAQFGSAEDTDMLVRLVQAGVVFRYTEGATVYHPELNYDLITPQKSFNYGLGFGAFCRIHGWTGYFYYKLLRSIGGACLGVWVNSKSFANYWATLRGRWIGYWAWES